MPFKSPKCPTRPNKGLHETNDLTLKNVQFCFVEKEIHQMN